MAFFKSMQKDCGFKVHELEIKTLKCESWGGKGNNFQPTPQKQFQIPLQKAPSKTQSGKEHLKFLIITFLSISSTGLMGLLTESQKWCTKIQIVQEFKQRKKKSGEAICSQNKVQNFIWWPECSRNQIWWVTKDRKGTKEIPQNRGQLCCKLKNSPNQHLKLKEF